MTAQDNGDVLTERHGATLLVRLNRPQRHNAIGGTMLRDLAEAFDRARSDDGVRVVVLTGTGKSFCVGADVADFDQVAGVAARDMLAGELIGGAKGVAELSPDERVVDEFGNAGRWVQRIWSLDKPVIAAVNGAAVGGGFALTLLADLRVAGGSARFGTGFAAVGIAPEMGASLLLPTIVGAATAAELLFTSRMLTAEQARDIGLVSSVFDDDDLTDGALELAARIAANPPLGVRFAKRLLRRATAADLVGQLQAEHRAQSVLFDHPATHEAMNAVAGRVQRRREQP
ncbi:enoyl-CoA hydratase/isomerase family protein [Nakamurella lactea]|uniref:enoyl-CoA hydratase/isomerase family protein n=1 Tax=Nakamurella lactea TaxID=459515 RepID=UPI0004260BCC|nr:enoyl-CoA hydratase-related protein [Nakamurella lactea]